MPLLINAWQCRVVQRGDFLGNRVSLSFAQGNVWGNEIGLIFLQFPMLYFAVSWIDGRDFSAYKMCKDSDVFHFAGHLSFLFFVPTLKFLVELCCSSSFWDWQNILKAFTISLLFFLSPSMSWDGNDFSLLLQFLQKKRELLWHIYCWQPFLLSLKMDSFLHMNFDTGRGWLVFLIKAC